MSKVFFDIETNGLLENVHTLHCLEMCYESGEFNPNSKDMKLQQLQEHCGDVIGHNIICYDIPALKKIYSNFNLKGFRIIDTLLLSRMLYPELDAQDLTLKFRNRKLFDLLKEHKLIGKHSLKAWGYRLGFLKGNYGETTDWKVCTPEMIEYCKQDVLVTKKLYEFFIKNKTISWNAYDLEYEFQIYIFEQQQHGCHFNVGEAIKLKHTLLTELNTVKEEIKLTVPDWEEIEIFEPKRNNKVKGYVAGQKYERRTVIEFNPNSRMQIEKYLKQKYGWEPSELTKTGRAKINEDTLDELEALNYVEAKLFSKYLTLTKLLGYISEGDNAWLKLVRNNRIHGQLITCGAITRRCTHFKPNLGQVPSTKKYMGKECRSLFHAPKGFKFVGADMSGIELRCFGHYLSAYDGGTYANIILNGDIHTRNQQDAGLPTRDSAKTFIYALLYGAGDAKIGLITRPNDVLNIRKNEGNRLKSSFRLSNPSYVKLTADIYRVLRTRGFIKGIDGHYLTPRSAHSGLNTLLQNCAAVLMKRATIIFRRYMIEKGWWMSKVFPVLHVHDEVQCIALPEIAEEVGQLMVKSMNEAGEYYKLCIRVDGEYKIGNNWKETH